MTKTEKKAFAAGWAAFFANHTAAECPHKFATPEMRAWCQGHIAAEESLESVHGPNGAFLLPMEAFPMPSTV